MLKITFSGVARRSPSLTRMATVRAKAAAAEPQPSRMAKAKVSPVVISSFPGRGSTSGNDSTTTRQISNAQNTGGSCCTVATPPWLASNASEPKPTAETVST
jgi:hypothetical protein